MATKVSGLIQKINPGNGTQYSIASTAYGYCTTAAGTTEKVVDMTGFTLTEGITIHVKFQYSNAAENPTLNVNGTGAKAIKQYGTTAVSTSNQTTGWNAGAVVMFTYDGTYWVRDQGYNTNTTYSSLAAASKGTDVSLVTTGEKYTWNNKADKATTLAGYGITDAKITNGTTITLGSNSITPLTADSTLDATKLSGTIPSSCYTDTDTKNTAGSTNSTAKLYLIGATSQANNAQTYSNSNFYIEEGNPHVCQTAKNGAAIWYHITDKPTASGGKYGVQWLNVVNNSGRFYFGQYSGTDSSITKYREVYALPQTDSGRTSTSNYDILTSKNAVTIAQGGTGKTTAAAAWTALGGGSVGKLSLPTSNQTTTFLRGDGTWAASGSSVSITRDLTSGTKIATITIDGTATDLYCETDTNTNTKAQQVLTTTNANYPVLFSYYETSNTTATVNNTIRRNNSIFVNPSTGTLTATKVYGAVYNDYAEYRQTREEIEPGRCIIENGDGTLSLSTQRLMRGCEIVSDTFGFAIGKTEKCQTPIATSGRVLAYCLEGQEYAKNYTGWPVCSGPNGTVSIMTEEEEEKYPSRIIGTISEVPTYDTWGSNNVKINGRIWIRVR